MSQISPIEDSYIDGIISSAGAYNPSLNKTQGVQLRALIKLLRDWGDQQLAAVADQVVPAGGTTGQVLAKNSNTNDDTKWIDPPTGGGALPTVTNGEKVLTITAAGPQITYDTIEQYISAAALTGANFSTGSAAVSGQIGQVAYDSTYRYECIGTNQWIRQAINNHLVDLYLADIDDSAGDKTSAELIATYPAAVVGQRVWGTNNLYEMKSATLWKKMAAVNA